MTPRGSMAAGIYCGTDVDFTQRCTRKNYGFDKKAAPAVYDLNG